MSVANCGAFYFDASALVKLVADDDDEKDGREAVRNLYWNNANMYATSYCVTETSGVFKRKFNQKQIGHAEYVRYCMDFTKKILGGNLHIDEVPIVSVPIFQHAGRLMTKYGIDFVDSLQLITLLCGKSSIMINESQSLFVTADDALANAARKEGARVSATQGHRSASVIWFEAFRDTSEPQPITAIAPIFTPHVESRYFEGAASRHPKIESFEGYGTFPSQESRSNNGAARAR